MGPSPLMMSGAFPMQLMMGAAQMRAAQMPQPVTAMFVPEEHTDAVSIQIVECNAVSGFSCLASRPPRCLPHASSALLSCVAFSTGFQDTQIHAAGIPRRSTGTGSEEPGVLAAAGTDVGSASSAPAGATPPAPTAVHAGHPLAAASPIWGSHRAAADGVGPALPAAGVASGRHAGGATLAQHAHAHAAQHDASTASTYRASGPVSA